MCGRNWAKASLAAMASRESLSTDMVSVLILANTCAIREACVCGLVPWTVRGAGTAEGGAATWAATAVGAVVGDCRGLHPRSARQIVPTACSSLTCAVGSTPSAAALTAASAGIRTCTHVPCRSRTAMLCPGAERVTRPPAASSAIKHSPGPRSKVGLPMPAIASAAWRLQSPGMHRCPSWTKSSR